MSNTPVPLVSSASSPSVAYQANGSWLLVWSSSDGSGNGVWGQRYAADGSTLGAIYQINTNPADSQDGAQVTTLADGFFVVTWHEGADIYGQRLTSDGVPTGDEFFVASGVDDSFIDPSGLSGHEVAALADGGFVIVTRANPGFPSDWIALRQYDADGVALTTEPIAVNTYDVSRQGMLHVTALSGGGYVVVWTAETGGLPGVDNWGIFAQQFSADGTPLNAEFHVNTTTNGVERFSQTLALEDGGYLIMWRPGDGGDVPLRMQRFGEDGRTIGVETEVALGVDPAEVENLPESFLVEPLGGDNFALLWRDAEGNYQVQCFDVTGAALTGVTTIDAVAPLSDRMDIDLRADGHLQITWVGSDANIYHFIVEDVPSVPTGGPSPVEEALGTELVSTVYTASSPSVAYQEDGSWLLVWSSSDGSGNGVWGQRYAADGSTLGAIYQINTNPADSQDGAQVTTLADGSFVVTWHEGYALYGQRLDQAGQAIGAEFSIGTGEGASVAALEGGGFAVTFRGTPGSTADWVGLRQYDAEGVALTSAPVAANTYGGGRQANMTVTGLEGGGYVVVWNGDAGGLGAADAWGIFAQQFDALGNRVNTEFHVNTTTAGTQRYGHVVAMDDGGYLILWRDMSGEFAIRMQRFGADGNMVGSETPLAVGADTSVADDFEVVELAEDGFALLWRDGSGDRLYVQRFDVTGVAVTERTTIEMSSSAGTNGMIDLDLRADGLLQVTWIGGDANIYHHILEEEVPVAPGEPAGTTEADEIIFNRMPFDREKSDLHSENENSLSLASDAQTTEAGPDLDLFFWDGSKFEDSVWEQENLQLLREAKSKDESSIDVFTLTSLLVSDLDQILIEHSL